MSRTVARVVLTRPVAEGRVLAQALARQGIEADVLPLLAIEPLGDDALLQAARAQASRYQAWMFVSAAAVRHFLPLPDAQDGADTRVHADAAPRCWVTGPGSAAALVGAGVDPARIDQPPPDSDQFDSEALWLQVRAQVSPATRVLIVRGANAQGRLAGRDWLARTLEDAGAQCEQVAAYRRVPAPWTAAQHATAQAAAGDGSLWFFSSSQAVAQLPAMLPGHDWSMVRALVTHPRIGEAARAIGFTRVHAVRAEAAALAASIESLQ